MSTLGRTLDEEGFIHCSADGAQGATVLHNYYADIDEPLVVLVIDTERVPSEIRYEVPGGVVGCVPPHLRPAPRRRRGRDRPGDRVPTTVTPRGRISEAGA